MISTIALGQQSDQPADTEREAPGTGGAATLPQTIFMPYMEMEEGGLEWESLEAGKFYEISNPAYWNGPKTADADSTVSQENLGWVMDADSRISHYISINEYSDMLTWLTMEEQMLEMVTDTTVARVVGKKAVESKHTIDVSGEYLDIVGTLSGPRRENESKNFQVMTYAGKLVMYDYTNKIMRLLSTEPKDKEDIIKEQN